MKLLLVDDDVFLRDMYVVKFTESGHTVEVADGASSALLKLRQIDDFDVVMLDMIMPGMSGIEIIKVIKRDFSDQNKLKCIILSNQGQTEDKREAKEAGAAGYIIKAESVPSDVVKKVEAIYKK